MDKVRTLFVGSSGIAIPVLEKLLELEYIDLVGVVTQPDKPVGRKRLMTPPPVKLKIKNEKRKTKIYQPIKLKQESAEILDEVKPDLILVASYRQFIQNDMLEYPKYRCLNVHPSILPDLRGATPMPMAILNGYEETGVTVQIMGEEMDAGDVLGVRKWDLGVRETTETLTDRAGKEASELLGEILPRLIDGSIKPHPQDHSKATFCYEKDISKENAEIDWDKSAVEVDRMIRAFDPWPIAWFELTDKNTDNDKFWGKRIKIFDAIETPCQGVSTEPGKLFKQDKKLFIQTREGVLELNEIQVEGKKKMLGKEAFFIL